MFPICFVIDSTEMFLVVGIYTFMSLGICRELIHTLRELRDLDVNPKKDICNCCIVSYSVSY